MDEIPEWAMIAANKVLNKFVEHWNEAQQFEAARIIADAAPKMDEDVELLLNEIIQKKGAFSMDNYEHACNCLAHGADCATKILAKLKGTP